MTARIAYFVFFAPEGKKTWRPSLKAARIEANFKAKANLKNNQFRKMPKLEHTADSFAQV